MVRGKGNASPEARHPPPCPREKAMLGMLCSMELHRVPNSTFWAPHPLQAQWCHLPMSAVTMHGLGKASRAKARRDQEGHPHVSAAGGMQCPSMRPRGTTSIPTLQHTKELSALLWWLCRDMSTPRSQPQRDTAGISPMPTAQCSALAPDLRCNS